MSERTWLVSSAAWVGGCGLVGFGVSDPGGDAARGGDGTLATPSLCPAGEVDGAYATDLSTTMPGWATVFDQPGGAISLVDGELRIAPSTSQPVPAYLSMLSPASDLHERRVFTEVSEMVTTSAALEAGIWISGSGLTYTGVVQYEGMFGYNHVVNGAPVSSRSVPYDPVPHRWWQLREAAGRTYFETSADGASWTLFDDIATPAHFASASIELGAGTYGPVAVAPGAVQFELLADCLPGQ